MADLLSFPFSGYTLFCHFSKGLLKIVMRSCCGMCTRLTHLKPFKSIEEASVWFYNASSYSIMMPALAASKSETYFGNPFVKLMDTPGVVYVIIDNSAEEFGRKVLASIGGTWPLLIITLLLTAQGGVFMWLLVCFSYLYFPLINRLRSPFCIPCLFCDLVEKNCYRFGTAV